MPGRRRRRQLEPGERGAQVEPGSAGDDRGEPAREDVVDRGVREPLVLGHRAVVVERPDRGQVRGPVGLVGEDRQPAVDLHRVRGHDLARQPVRDRLGDRRLPGGGRAEDRENPETRSLCALRGTPTHHPLLIAIPEIRACLCTEPRRSGVRRRRAPPGARRAWSRSRRSISTCTSSPGCAAPAKLTVVLRRVRPRRRVGIGAARALDEHLLHPADRAPRCARPRCAGRRPRAARAARASARTGADPATRPPRCPCAPRR